jgi:hypothetical protein
MSNIDSLSINISQALKRKYPEINYQHYAPQFIKDFIQQSNINFKTKEGIEKIVSSLTHNMNYLKEKMNKERQTKGIVDFDFNSNHVQHQKIQPIPQQQLVVRNQIQTPIYDNSQSKKEFLNPNPLIIDSSMISSLNQNQNQNQTQTQTHPQYSNQNQQIVPILSQDYQKIYLNQIQSKNAERSNNYQSFPANPSNKDVGLSALSNLPQEINQTDRFILMDKQKDLLKEDTSEWTYYLVIDSKDRDINIYKSPNEYTIRFSPPSFNSKDARTGFVDRIMHNVKSIELIKCGFLDTSELDDSSDSGNNNPAYIMLEVEEFGTNHNGTNQYLNKSLAILDTFEKQDNYKYYKVMYDDKPMINKFNPRVTIDKMTIRFRLPDGSLYNFGSTNNTNTSTVNYVVFKITVVQRFLETQYLNQTDG